MLRKPLPSSQAVAHGKASAAYRKGTVVRSEGSFSASASGRMCMFRLNTATFKDPFECAKLVDAGIDKFCTFSCPQTGQYCPYFLGNFSCLVPQ